MSLHSLRYPFPISFGLSSLCRVLAILCSLLAGKSHSLVLSPAHNSFCFCCEGDIRVSFLPFRIEVFCASVICAPRLHPLVFLRRVRCIRDTPEHTQNMMESPGNQRTSQCLHVGVENGSNNFMLAFTWLNGSLFMHVSPSCTIQMTEWICWYKPFGIQRGESYQQGHLESGEKWTSSKAMSLEKTSRA